MGLLDKLASAFVGEPTVPIATVPVVGERKVGRASENRTAYAIRTGDTSKLSALEYCHLAATDELPGEHDPFAAWDRKGRCPFAAFDRGLI